MFDTFIETSPFEPSDKDGFSKGIIHRSRSCPSIVAWVFPAFDDPKWKNFLIKIGRGTLLKIKKSEPRCPDCFTDNTMEKVVAKRS